MALEKLDYPPKAVMLTPMNISTKFMVFVLQTLTSVSWTTPVARGVITRTGHTCVPVSMATCSRRTVVAARLSVRMLLLSVTVQNQEFSEC